MLERLVNLMTKLKDIFLRMDECQEEAAGNEIEIAALHAEITSLKKDQADAIIILDELEEAIKKWE